MFKFISKNLGGINMSCDNAKSCFLTEIGKGIKFIIIICTIVLLMPYVSNNLSIFFKKLNIDRIETKDFAINFFETNLNEILKEAKKDSITKDELTTKLQSLAVATGDITSHLNMEQFRKNTTIPLNNIKCVQLTLTKDEIKNHLGLNINDSNLLSYVNKEIILLKSIDTYSGCSASYSNPITIKINSPIFIRSINKDGSVYNLDVEF